ncbi:MULTISPECIES: nitrate ABC transporter permease [Methylovorus]|uniref:nitrate ABC transporter permease n=1 Tax=Methylovorus TaxID=81682 RepID=UPI0001EC43BD|nr:MULTISPECIES: nitrate ABC transporter permease [Methylovorus]ADQ83554.1 nitrate ABC transporter, inner membrane subunit [Methylovorus sp. MP688]KAF0836218.1 nitrate/nitrite transport system permease protein [Methylovorus glucosotrophus]
MSAIGISKESIKTIMQNEQTTPTAVKAAVQPAAARMAPSKRPSARALKLRAFFEWLLPPVFGVLAMIAVWTLISYQSPNLPGPVSTWHSAVELFSDPFYNNSPNDQGIGWNILASLERVGLGFGLAALVGIPLGFIIGRFQFMSRMAAPIIGILRPVSPLAWLPIGLLVFKAANPAAIWVIFISAIWPMIINTAVGVSKVPQDYMNVAKVLNLSEWKIVTKILFPFVLPYMMTGVRLSIGVAWLVIVAAEMLTGGVGIGFWVWDEWNNLNVEHIIIAIFVVGIVGLLLELALTSLARRFSYE